MSLFDLKDELEELAAYLSAEQKGFIIYEEIKKFGWDNMPAELMSQLVNRFKNNIHIQKPVLMEENKEVSKPQSEAKEVTTTSPSPAGWMKIDQLEEARPASAMTPSQGRIVEVNLTTEDCNRIYGTNAGGKELKAVAIIVRVWPDGSANLKILGDSDNIIWVVSRKQGDEIGQWHAFPRV